MNRFPADNQWFLLVGLIVSYGVVLLLPRKLPRSVSFLMMMLSASLALGFDHTIGVPPYDLYDTNIDPAFTLADLFLALLYLPFGYFFVYGYRQLKIRRLGIPFYILVWSLFGTGFEAIALHFHVYTYKGWSLRYSFVVYVCVQLISVIYYHLLMRRFAQLKTG
jgi:hypothetical protein